jgi:hypothetical protein
MLVQKVQICHPKQKIFKGFKVAFLLIRRSLNIVSLRRKSVLYIFLTADQFKNQFSILCKNQLLKQPFLQ